MGKLGFQRPKVAELVFQVFGRPLHPELFETVASRRVLRDHYEATIAITQCGHVVTWRCGDTYLSEVATSAAHPLPQRRRLVIERLRGERCESIALSRGVRYETSFQLERLPAEVFWQVQEGLADDGARRGLFFSFAAPSRIAVAALSFVNFESRARSLLVHTFHTFPDELALVKTQSLFER